VDALLAWRPPPPDRSLLHAVSGATSAASLQRLRDGLFEPAAGAELGDGGLEVVTGAGEQSEARAIVRRLLREAARGVPFEEMAVLLARPEPYAAILTDLLDHAHVPWRLHPSLPLRTGRAARSLLLLLRCRGLARAAVMELLTFAPVPFAEMLGEEVVPRPAAWDGLSREASVVRGMESWIIGLRAYAESQEELAGTGGGERAERARRRGHDAEALLRVVELLGGTLDALSGEASWPDWSARLQDALAVWIGPAPDRDAVLAVIQDLAGLGSVAGPARVRATEMETVLEARLDWERHPLRPQESGAVHLGSFDALCGVPFRVVAIPGLVEGGYPGAIRPDPFLLDEEREALARPAPDAGGGKPTGPRRQLSLFDAEPAASPPVVPAGPPVVLPTTQDRLLRARREFRRACAQATEKLILSWPRSDARSGRERLPSLFLVAAAATVAGRPLGMAELQQRTTEDALQTLDLDHAVDAGERDLARLLRSADAAAAIGAGSRFFRGARTASSRRWSGELTEYDGVLVGLPSSLRRGLDLVARAKPVSASALGAWGQCGFLFMLREVLRLEPLQEPEERLGLDALEKGRLFHDVAEAFLRERQQKGELPLTASDALRRRLHEMARLHVELLVKTRPPRFRLLWDLEWQGFLDLLDRWLDAEVSQAAESTPLAFEVAFGLPRAPGQDGPHLDEPLPIELGDGRVLRVSGRIDRIDSLADGTLLLRDYKTGQRPKNDPGLFRGGRQLQIPFYVLAAQALFPGRRVGKAFLDFVGSGRVSFDPEAATGAQLQQLLRLLVDAVSDGLFAQEPTACKWCDFDAVCGPQPLLELRGRWKRADPQARRILEVRDVK
jgi:ATP-dependent helicase/nuclease subunit B